MFSAMQKGQVARVVPIIGTLIPLVLLIHAAFFHTVTQTQTIAVVILIAGLIFLTFSDWIPLRQGFGGQARFSKKELFFEITSALLFALSYLVLRQAYLRESFLTVFVYSRMILIPVGAAILLMPKLSKTVFSSSDKKIDFLSKTGLLFLAGQAAGGTQELLLTFSISLATPALVNSLQGIQYVFIFLFTYCL